MGMHLEDDSTTETIELGRILGDTLEPGDCIVLCGDLGAGKTHFVKGIAAALGMTEEITSPTFNIVYEYASGRLPLNHFDLYRLERADELDDIPYWELIEGSGVSVIEWGDRFSDRLPDDYLSVTIEIVSEDHRLLRIEGHGRRGEQLAADFVCAASSC